MILPAEFPSYDALKKLADRFPQIDPSAVLTLLQLIHLSQNLLAAGDAHFSEFGISQGRFLVLMLLLKEPEHTLSPSALAEKAEVSRATITGLLDSLERDNFIERRQDPTDRRSLVVHLTPTGQAFMDGMLPTHFIRIAKVMENLSEKERKELLRLLAKVRLGITNFTYSLHSNQKEG
jgi:DNA-binding MarR family transcriptional regulator